MYDKVIVDKNQSANPYCFGTYYSSLEIEEKNMIDFGGTDEEFETKWEDFKLLLEKVLTFNSMKNTGKQKAKLIPNVSLEWIKQLKV